MVRRTVPLNIRSPLIHSVIAIPATAKHEGQLANSDSSHTIFALLDDDFLATSVLYVYTNGS